jgi:two-component system sensor histidine kinase UhpB
MISFYDASGRILFVNREWENTLGWSLDQAQQMDILSAIYPDPDERRRAVEFIHKGERRWADFRLQARDGRFVDSSWARFQLSDGTSIGFGLDITERRRADERLRFSAARLQAMSRHILVAQETERRRVAVELHDEIGQSLAMLKLTLEALSKSLSGSSGDPRIDESIRIVVRLLQQTRDLSLNLRPSILDDLGLAAALRWLIDHLFISEDLEVQFLPEIGDERFSAECEVTCFRIAQAALTNVLHHSGARHLRIGVRRESGEIVLTVADDGRGFDVDLARHRAQVGESLGLLGMEERAALAGGRIEIDSAPGKGTRVTLRIPVHVAGALS